MNLKLLMVVGAVVSGIAICTIAVAAEPHSTMVIAQAAPVTNPKDKDKPRVPAGAAIKTQQPPAMKPAQKPVLQQQKPPLGQPGQQKPAQLEMKKLPATTQQPAVTTQQKPMQMQKPGAVQPAIVTPQKPALGQPEPQKPVQMEMKKLPATTQQPAVTTQQKPVQVQKPGFGQPVTQTPAIQLNKGQNPVVQTQQHPVVAPVDRRLDKVRVERHETHVGNRTIIQEQNRTIIRENGRTFIRHDDTDRFRLGARDVHVERRGNNMETIIVRPNGARIITIVDANGRLLRRIRREPDGREFILIDNRYEGPRDSFGYIVDLPPPIVRMPRDRYIVDADRADRGLLYETLIAPPVMHIDRRYTLDEIRYTQFLRERMPRIDLDTVTFDTGSWDVTPDQARLLEPIGDAMLRAIRRNPNEVFLIEGHTDAVGNDVDNLSLSDRRAEAVASILTQDFGIPPENLTTQGYGEQYLKIPTQAPERRNRRVTVRRITPLLTGRN
jgi:flagellar motor protein MotB